MLNFNFKGQINRHFIKCVTTFLKIAFSNRYFLSHNLKLQNANIKGVLIKMVKYL
jgi:hypothetical protein